MAQQYREEAIKRICGYLSKSLKQSIFDLLYSVYKVEEDLAEDIGCSIETLRKWNCKEAEIESENYMTNILTLALIYCSETKELLEEGLLKNIQRLLGEIDIKSKEQKKGAKEKMRMFLNELDVNNRKIFWHFQWYRHARITELTKLTADSNDMEILYRLRDVINPLAVKVFGNPILEFNESKIDNVTGRKILFNWWLLDVIEDDKTINVGVEKPLIDIFDEEDKIIIISDISTSIKVRDSAKVEQRNGILSVKLEKF